MQARITDAQGAAHTLASELINISRDIALNQHESAAAITRNEKESADKIAKLEAESAAKILALGQEAAAEREKLLADVRSEQKSWAQEKAMIDQTYQVRGERCNINVGGQVFVTNRTTLEAGHMRDTALGAMFSGRHTIADHDEGTPFFDRDPDLFKYILSYARSPGAFVPPRESVERQKLVQEAMFFKLPKQFFGRVSPAAPADGNGANGGMGEGEFRSSSWCADFLDANGDPIGVSVNVGGQLFSAHASLFQSPSAAGTLLAGLSTDGGSADNPGGETSSISAELQADLWDCDPLVFSFILSYLRSPKEFIPPDDPTLRLKLVRDAYRLQMPRAFFGVDDSQREGQASSGGFQRYAWCADYVGEDGKPDYSLMVLLTKPSQFVGKWRSTAGGTSGTYWDWNQQADNQAWALQSAVAGQSFVAPCAAVYIVSVRCSSNNNGSNRPLQLHVNGSNVSTSVHSSANGYNHSYHLTEAVQLKSGDKLQVYQTLSGQPDHTLNRNSLSIVQLPDNVAVGTFSSTSGASTNGYRNWNATVLLRAPQQELRLANDRVTVSTPGKYVVMGRCGRSGTNGNNNYMALYVNGSQISQQFTNDAHGHYQSFHINEVFDFKAGDYLQIYVAGNGNVYNNQHYNRLSLVKLPQNSLVAKWQSAQTVPNGSAWSWTSCLSSPAFTQDQDATTIVVKKTGSFMCMVRCCGTSTNNTANILLTINGQPISCCPQSDSSGFWNTWHLDEVLNLVKGDKLRIIHSHNGSTHTSAMANVLSLFQV